MVTLVRRRTKYFTSPPKRWIFAITKREEMRISERAKLLKRMASVALVAARRRNIRQACIVMMIRRILLKRLIKVAFVPLDVWKLFNRKWPKNSRKVSFDDFPPEDIETFFKFRNVHDLRVLMRCFQVPESIQLTYGHMVTGEEAMMIGLYRLHFPTKLDEMARMFGRDSSTVSRIVRWFLDFFINNWIYLLTNNCQMWAPHLDYYCEVIRKKAEAVL